MLRERKYKDVDREKKRVERQRFKEGESNRYLAFYSTLYQTFFLLQEFSHQDCGEKGSREWRSHFIFQFETYRRQITGGLFSDWYI